MPNNWVKTSLAGENYGMYEVDGYTVKNKTVTSLMDYVSNEELNTEISKQSIEDVHGADTISAKLRLSECLGCPYYLVHYSGNIQTYKVGSKTLRHKDTFADSSDFGEWTMQIRDRKINKYTRDTSSWTSLEEELIDNDVGAPGDLDSFIYQDGEVRAIIEWQTTNKKSPEDHSNNRWFSDDVGRWKPLWTLSQRLNVPLIIIVWSPKIKYPDVRIKTVNNIEFNGHDSGLSYSSDHIISNAKSNTNQLTNELSKAINES